MNIIGILLTVGIIGLVGYLAYGLYVDIRERNKNKKGGKHGDS